MANMDYYEFLGIDKNAPQKEVLAALDAQEGGTSVSKETLQLMRESLSTHQSRSNYNKEVGLPEPQVDVQWPESGQLMSAPTDVLEGLVVKKYYHDAPKEIEFSKDPVEAKKQAAEAAKERARVSKEVDEKLKSLKSKSSGQKWLDDEVAKIRTAHDKDKDIDYKANGFMSRVRGAKKSLIEVERDEDGQVFSDTMREARTVTAASLKKHQDKFPAIIKALDESVALFNAHIEKLDSKNFRATLKNVTGKSNAQVYQELFKFENQVEAIKSWSELMTSSLGGNQLSDEKMESRAAELKSEYPNLLKDTAETLHTLNSTISHLKDSKSGKENLLRDTLKTMKEPVQRALAQMVTVSNPDRYYEASLSYANPHKRDWVASLDAQDKGGTVKGK